jgi:regulator of replication initiation timing
MTDTSRAINDLQALHTTLIAENSALALRVELLEKGLHDANAAIKELQIERDEARRQSTELMTVCNNIATLATGAAEKVGHLAYRLDPTDRAIPQFLLKDKKE